MSKASELRNKAKQHEQAREESWQRSDTDGFLSQWAHGLNAQLAREQAEIEENDGKAWFENLMENNRRVDAKLIPGKFGAVWLLSDKEEQRFGRRFIPFAGTGKSRVQKQLGLHEDEELAPAKAIIRGSGRGLSGNAWVTVIRTDGK